MQTFHCAKEKVENFFRKGPGDLTCVSPKICSLEDAAVAMNNQQGFERVFYSGRIIFFLFFTASKK